LELQQQVGCMLAAEATMIAYFYQILQKRRGIAVIPALER
jgi:hypothetical protein